jgi:Sec-independent protein translocase protein TatA
MSPFPAAFISPGGSEFLLIMLVLILLFGAKDAPRIFRSIHNALDKMQRAAASFRYKIMYGDLYQDTSAEEPYDVDAHYPDEDGESSEFGTENPEEETEHSEEEAKNSETETEDSEPKA